MTINLEHKKRFEVRRPEDLCCEYCAYSRVKEGSEAYYILCHLNPDSVAVPRAHHCGYGFWYFGGDLDRYLEFQDVLDQREGEVSSYFAQDHSKPEPAKKSDWDLALSHWDLYVAAIRRIRKALKLLEEEKEKWSPGSTRFLLQQVIDTLEGEKDA